MRALQREQLAWVVIASVTLGSGGALGWAQAQRDLQLAAAAAAVPREGGPRPLALPRPPSKPTTEERSPPAIARKSAIPPPGGFPVDVLQEMWEVSLQTPHKIGDTPLTAENWFITGVVMQGAEQQVIVQRGSDPKPHFHKVGDLLPGGARIAWVRPSAIGLITPKSERISLPLRR
ncbi:hypothetical protein QTI33_14435 [Variovorax sp. J22P271]|uniref:hypothetical protein n=1 Tax=Variovorax davisae TaxID=3053515 RepID=UPI0025782A0A|nr:hypothetical protein [Variovorax sp. J22P271]MDM0033329.1 hypothetical protein [Variovorax sp. J22P271]